MANRPKARKRVVALLCRAPDGSAYGNCQNCGVSVAIAIADMHECQPTKKDVKRFKGIAESHHTLNQSIQEYNIKIYKSQNMNLFEADRMGFYTWKNMSDQERKHYISEAKKLNSDYEEALLKEVEDMVEHICEDFVMNLPVKVDDEADSATVGRVDQTYKGYEENWYMDLSDTEYDSDCDILDSWSSDKPALRL